MTIIQELQINNKKVGNWFWLHLICALYLFTYFNYLRRTVDSDRLSSPGGRDAGFDSTDYQSAHSDHEQADLSLSAGYIAWVLQVDLIKVNPSCVLGYLN